jgi:hypothetical protein
VKRRPLEETLRALHRVRESPDTEESHRELRQVRSSEGSHAVARAAALVGETGIESLVPDLVAAFSRFFDNLPRADPGCSAKTGIVEALRRLGQDVDLADLLADPEPPVGISAARAVAAHVRGGGVPLLHLRALAGDPEPRVVSACLLALLRPDAPGEMRFVASFLERDAAAAEAAAIALGESRLAEALAVLRAWLDPARRRGLGRTTVGQPA